MRPVLTVALACLAAATVAPAHDAPSLHRQVRKIMGTFCEIQVYHDDAPLAERAIASALDEMQRVDRLLSNYDPASELSALNREAPRGPVRVSDELFQFVKRCREYFTATGGAFDPTVGPLVRAWGFFTPRPAKPPDDQIAAARAVSGFAKVRLDETAGTVSYTVAGLELDPGGIGKGYAVDMAVKVLQRAGIASALVSAGGSTLYAIGHPPGRPAWTLGIGDPTNRERPVRVVHLRDASVSTSGVSEKFVVVDGHRYSHIFDPRSGNPVEGMCQVSVVAAGATESDALTKAAFILPREAVQRLFEPDKRIHVLRMEGACGPEHIVWTTPWSAGVFTEKPETP
ncbi:MAG: FAD:protein FMN transferase [Acidobacteria bacterium]|nr:FAD:protein FMN transferase [Acidobacteriota bacterium]